MTALIPNTGSYMQKLFTAYVYNRIELITEQPQTLCSFFDSFEHGSKDFFILLSRNIPEKYIYKKNSIIYLTNE